MRNSDHAYLKNKWTMAASHTHICPQTTCSIKPVLSYCNDLMGSGSELREQSTNLTYRQRVLFWRFYLSSRGEQKKIESVIPSSDATVLYENLTKVLSSQLVPIKSKWVCLWKFNAVESLFLVILKQKRKKGLKMHSCNSDTLFLHKHGGFPQFSLGFFPFFSSLIPFYLQRQSCSKQHSILAATQADSEEGSHYLTANVSASQPIS